MKYNMKRFWVSAFILFVVSLSATPYAIKGKIIDSRNGNPIRKAVIIAKDDSAKFLAGLNSDQDGIFITADINRLYAGFRHLRRTIGHRHSGAKTTGR